MRYYHLVLATIIFLIVFLILGLRGIPGAVCAVLALFGGIAIGKREATVFAWIDDARARIRAFFEKAFS